MLKHPVRSFKQWYWEVRRYPAQTAMDMAVLKAILAAAGGAELRVFEWGAGKSTIYYPKFLKSLGREFQWFAVDNSRAWQERCQRAITAVGLDNQVKIHCYEFPPFWELPGYSPVNPLPPANPSNSEEVRDYVEFPRVLGGCFDVVIVDGRYRRRCLRVAKEVLTPEGVVVLHDADRPHYQGALSFFPNVVMLETGELPGTNQKSAVALCSGEDNELVHKLKEIYSDHQQNSLNFNPL